MINRYGYLLKTFLLLTAAFYRAPVTAEEEAPLENWYQVEMIVFERVNPIRLTDSPEAWNKNLALAYPPNWKELITPTPEDELEEGEEEPIIDLNSEPFIRLPSEYWQQMSISARIKNDRSLRLLFHEAWRQPMQALEEAPAIIIQGGEQYGEHFELEGSVTLFIGRYLHIHTNLWLTQFKSNYGQPPKHWPPLPKRPESINFYDNADNELLTKDLSLGETPFSMEQNDNAHFGDGLLTLESPKETEADTWTIPGSTHDEYSQLVNQPYLISQIVHMKQKRRMRSKELHYLDHPRLGILVKLTKYEPEHKDVLVNQDEEISVE